MQWYIKKKKISILILSFQVFSKEITSWPYQSQCPIMYWVWTHGTMWVVTKLRGSLHWSHLLSLVFQWVCLISKKRKRLHLAFEVLSHSAALFDVMRLQLHLWPECYTSCWSLRLILKGTLLYEALGFISLNDSVFRSPLNKSTHIQKV